MKLTELKVGFRTRGHNAVEHVNGINGLIHHCLSLSEQVGFDAFGVLWPSDSLWYWWLDNVCERHLVLPSLLVQESSGKQLANEAGSSSDENIHLVGNIENEDERSGLGEGVLALD